jgi:hypothetical protein
MEQGDLAGALRAVNEGIALLAESWDTRVGFPEVWSFRCECGHPDCHEWLTFKLSEYGALVERAGSRLLAPGHPVSKARRMRAQSRELREHAEALRGQAGHQVRRARRACEPQDGTEPPPGDPAA